ncbi:hypothetical protein ASE61_04280 [Bosea sp. Root670]|jgi:pilus assembly protein Flp/PilA|uniref:Pilus assembly protein Flp/PilA n=1 Tax=Bosea robiniae TaxID=1036780 RepID=A0ABY0NIH5_9HYPH|nr:MULTISPECIES: Flp family type IVb pilin [Bosea]KRE08778.1 hypothetical protein ASE61_04280 [Bosea sp. Root670]TQI76015.1 pilus assembly protein Flp/PilA [Bosea sp. AK1]SDF54335.1 pilus assembly protein Flp/PilA [Bosea robiniae]
MGRIKASFLEFARDARGATVIEYGLIAGLVSITIITSATFYGNQISSFLLAAADAIKVP